MKTLGLYLHIPFCRSKCLYCDFCSVIEKDAARHEAYVSALCKDLAAKAPLCADHTVDTVYFGGGTPTILSAQQLCRLMDAVARNYRLSPGAEITAECNPVTGSAELFRSLRKKGFNRLSIGLQSIHAEELRALGRTHRYEGFLSAFSDARDAGFENISVDVMTGIPRQTPESWNETLERITALAPEHISAYGLSVEEGTPFGRMGDRLLLPDEETCRAMYFDGIARLSAAGYRQYEISNFAKAGYESRHNLKYWSCDEYLGFGPAAYSDFRGERFGNSRDIAAYISGGEILAEREALSREERANEYVMLRMRLSAGVNAAEFERRYGLSFEETFGKKLSRYLSGGFVRRTEEGYAFTPEGMYVSNTILSDILDFTGDKNEKTS